MLFLSDTLLLHHAVERTARLRAEAALHDDVVVARRAAAAATGRPRAFPLAGLRSRLARALGARLERRAPTGRIDRGSGSAAAHH